MSLSVIYILSLLQVGVAIQAGAEAKYPDKKREQKLKENVQEVSGYLEEDNLEVFPKFIAVFQLGILYDDEWSYYAKLMEEFNDKQLRKHGDALKNEVIRPYLVAGVDYLEQSWTIVLEEFGELENSQTNMKIALLERLTRTYDSEHYPNNRPQKYDVNELENIIAELEGD